MFGKKDEQKYEVIEEDRDKSFESFGSMIVP